MTDETHLAFAHPIERSEATAGADPLDRISVRDLTVDVEIGAFQVERDTTQRLRFNVVVEVAQLDLNVADDVDKILSYDKVTEAVHTELAAERLNLLETLAERIGDRILMEPQAVRVFVRIEKLDRGPGVLGVEIVRSGATGNTPKDEAPLLPLVVYLSQDATRSKLLPGWVEQLSLQPEPVVFCVGPQSIPAPKATGLAAQFRIDLLAIEQNAWSVAAQIDTCEVVASRTELDWAMKNGQPCVWAPSKIVLDSVDGPKSDGSDGLALALWFAELIAAQSVLSIGERLPENPAIPARYVPTDSARL